MSGMTEPKTNQLNPGDEMWSVASGEVKPWIKASRDAVSYIAGLEGFTAVHLMPPDGRNTIFFFATEHDGIRARNLMRAKGIPAGDNVCRWVVAEDGVPEFADERAMGGE